MRSAAGCERNRILPCGCEPQCRHIRMRWRKSRVEAMILRGLPRKNRPGRCTELNVSGVIVLIVLLGIAFAAGYFTRDRISSKRRAEARRWREYSEPDWLTANAPANT